MYGFDQGVWMMGGWIVMLAFWLLSRPYAATLVGLSSVGTAILAFGIGRMLEHLALLEIIGPETQALPAC